MPRQSLSLIWTIVALCHPQTERTAHERQPHSCVSPHASTHTVRVLIVVCAVGAWQHACVLCDAQSVSQKSLYTVPARSRLHCKLRRDENGLVTTLRPLTRAQCGTQGMDTRMRAAQVCVCARNSIVACVWSGVRRAAQLPRSPMHPQVRHVATSHARSLRTSNPVCEVAPYEDVLGGGGRKQAHTPWLRTHKDVLTPCIAVGSGPDFGHPVRRHAVRVHAPRAT